MYYFLNPKSCLVCSTVVVSGHPSRGNPNSSHIRKIQNPQSPIPDRQVSDILECVAFRITCDRHPDYYN
jgi:hypothetical protein